MRLRSRGLLALPIVAVALITTSCQDSSPPTPLEPEGPDAPTVVAERTIRVPEGRAPQMRVQQLAAGRTRLAMLRQDGSAETTVEMDEEQGGTITTYLPDGEVVRIQWKDGRGKIVAGESTMTFEGTVADGLAKFAQQNRCSCWSEEMDFWQAVGLFWTGVVGTSATCMSAIPTAGATTWACYAAAGGTAFAYSEYVQSLLLLKQCHRRCNIDSWYIEDRRSEGACSSPAERSVIA